MKMIIKKYNLFRKIIKSLIIILWLLILSFPIAVVNIYAYCESCSIPSNGSTITSFNDSNIIRFYIWGFIEPYISHVITEYFTPPNTFYYFSLILFWIGFILNFGNIKQNYKNKIISKNLGYLSALIILIAIIGIFSASTSVNSGYTHPSINLNYKAKSWDLGTGFIFSIILIIIIITETLILNKIEIIPEEEKTVKEESDTIREREISGKIYCSSCGEEILDKTGDFCSKCGAPLK